MNKLITTENCMKEITKLKNLGGEQRSLINKINSIKKEGGRKITFVSFPVDYGNVTLRNNFLAMLEENFDVRHYSYSSKEAPDCKKKSLIARRLFRIMEIVHLKRICKEAKEEGRIVLFQQISPALFSLPFLKGVKTYILLDWTRKLYEPILKKKYSPKAITMLHSYVLKRVSGVVAFTDAAKVSLITDYSVPEKKIHYLPMPFDIYGTKISKKNQSGPLKLLFVGGDFYRKGGDSLVRWFENYSSAQVELTVITQSDVHLSPRIQVLKNNPSKSAKEYFSSYDIFVLPTRCDAYPQVIGEAASAGLAVITTNNALGGREIIDEGLNGYIVKSEEQLSERLTDLIKDREKVEAFKCHSRRKLASVFSFRNVAEQLEEIISENVTV